MSKPPKDLVPCPKHQVPMEPLFTSIYCPLCKEEVDDEETTEDIAEEGEPDEPPTRRS